MVGGSRVKTALVGCLGILATLTMVSGASAQDVRWNLSGPVGAGQRATLELVFEGARPDEDVELPRVEGLTANEVIASLLEEIPFQAGATPRTLHQTSST
mgnify:CR=1 FL=1